MPMFHTASCGMATLGALQAGCRMLIVKMFDAPAMNALIETEKVTTFIAVPTMLVGMCEALQTNSRAVSSTELIVCGGSMVAPDLVRNVQREFGCAFETVYGQTETSPITRQHHHDDTIEDICNTVGQPLTQTELSIRSTDTNAVMAVDRVGEICVRGYCCMTGYHGNENATAETIDGAGWTRAAMCASPAGSKR